MAALGESGATPPASCGTLDPGAAKTPKDPAALSEDAWVRINEAMETGNMILPNGRVIVLGVKEVVDLAKWLATLKAKRPIAPRKIEDFQPKETKK